MEEQLNDDTVAKKLKILLVTTYKMLCRLFQWDINVKGQSKKSFKITHRKRGTNCRKQNDIFP